MSEAETPPVRAATSYEEAVQFRNDWLKAEQEIRRLAAENECFMEQLEIRSESGMAKDMQEIMKANNALAAENVAQAERIKRLEEALRFYSNPGDYAAPQTGFVMGGENKLWSDCGTVARAALEPRDE